MTPMKLELLKISSWPWQVLSGRGLTLGTERVRLLLPKFEVLLLLFESQVPVRCTPQHTYPLGATQVPVVAILETAGPPCARRLHRHHQPRSPGGRGGARGSAQVPLLVSQSTLTMVTRVDEKGSEGAAATAIFTSRMMFVPKVNEHHDSFT